jgi:hypothetical protein
MGLYVDYKQAIRIQVPRDLHIGMIEYENVKIGDIIEVELKRSKFAINDTYILASGIFHATVESEKQAEVALPAAKVQSDAVEEPVVEEEPAVEVVEEVAEESEPEEVEEESAPEESESEPEEVSEE